MSLYIGLMSGTSLDGVDAAIVEFSEGKISIVESATIDYPRNLRSSLIEALDPHCMMSLAHFGSLDVRVGRSFARAARHVLKRAGVSSSEITAIGSHGQTLHHNPDGETPFTIQIGNPAEIAIATSITTVADFRSLDIAAGGQGAPLAPPFHEICFRSEIENRVVLNIGGIANITVLPIRKDLPVTGFDTGPGNCLMDGWISDYKKVAFDDRGKWSATGNVSTHLLDQCLGDAYFRRMPPKSTGREYFNQDWLRQKLSTLKSGNVLPADVQATLNELTARTIAEAILSLDLEVARVIVCGGGVYNDETLRKLTHALPSSKIQSCADLGFDPNMIEAAAFAWLAKKRMDEEPVYIRNGQTETHEILGAVYRKISS